jgi:hypothetical protein
MQLDEMVAGSQPHYALPQPFLRHLVVLKSAGYPESYPGQILRNWLVVRLLKERLRATPIHIYMSVPE